MASEDVVGEQPGTGSRSRVPRLVALAVSAVLAGSAVATFLVTHRAVREQEDSSLRERAVEVSALLSSAFGGVESSLRVLGNVGASNNQEAARVFTYTAAPLVETGTAAIGVAADRLGGFTVVAAVGDGPEIGAVLHDDRAALAARALETGKMVSGVVVDDRGTRLVLALGVGEDRSVIYEESVIDPQTPIPSNPSSPFNELRVVVYASSRPDPASLVLTTESLLPLSGQVERLPLTIGADQWLLEVSSRRPLVGSVARSVPWLLLFGGLTMALLLGAVAEVLTRRRAFAIAMVAERTADLQEANDELAEARAFVDSIVENIPHMVFVKSADDLRFVKFNKAGEELLGHAREELIGKNDYDFFSDAEADFFTQKDREVLDQRTLVDIPEEPVATKDGTRILHTKKLPILDQEGEPRFLLGISEDITERKDAELQLHEAKNEAERANRAKDEFLSRMSHELRTPLNAVLGFAQLLQMGSLDGDDSESVKQILRGGRHLLGLIDEVLDISRISTGQLSISQEPVSAAAAISEAVELVRPLAAERDIAFDVEEMNGTHVLADRQRLKQVLLNLLSNAVKYNRTGGNVRISTQALGSRVRIKVADTGPGISREAMERLFMPFDRLGAEASGVQGTGLGLALSKGLMDAMGGSLTAESVVGSGSVFSVELRLAETPIERYERGLASRAGSVPGVLMRTILYIEDNASNLELVERVVATRPRLRLISAMQGSQGLALARDHRPDVILLDLHLPDMPGEEVLRLLRGDLATQQIPVVVITADATRRRVDQLFAAGADDFLTKPLDVERFLQIVESILADELEAL